MREYFKKSAQNYGQGNQRLIISNPAIEKLLPRAKGSNKLLLDIACGNGYFCDLARTKGYKYFGTDVSSDLIKIAQNLHPDGNFVVDNAIFPKHKFTKKFDVILISMLFNALDKYGDIVKVLKNAKKLLKNDGVIIICNSYPPYDPYMQVGMLARKDVITNFRTYFNSGEKFTVNKQINGKNFTFEDYHWTMSDYIKALQEAGLRLELLDECQPDISKRHLDPNYYDQKKFYPTFVVMKVKIL